MEVACSHQALRAGGARPRPRRWCNLPRLGGGGSNRSNTWQGQQRSTWQAARMQAVGGEERNTGGLDPRLEREVPAEQRPVNELQQLKQAQLYSWVTAAAAAVGRLVFFIMT